MTERRLLLSFSGGETSALMCKLMLEHARLDYDDIRVVFANTGEEREEALEFVDRCDKAFGLGVVWIEADLPAERGIGTRIKVVDFASASREGEPFEKVIAKYGIPGPVRPLCSKELKGKPIKRWAREIGWAPRTYDLAIGIRVDEIDRMSPGARKNRIVYPMVSRFPHSKPMVSEFWARQSFRLNLKSYEGNCKWCWKKSTRKLLTIMQENPEAFSFPERMESRYPHAGPGDTGEPHRFFRENRTVQDLRDLMKQGFTPAADEARHYQVDLLDWISLNGVLDADMDLDACGAGESCEVDFGHV